MVFDLMFLCQLYLCSFSKVHIFLEQRGYSFWSNNMVWSSCATFLSTKVLLKFWLRWSWFYVYVQQRKPDQTNAYMYVRSMSLEVGTHWNHLCTYSFLLSYCHLFCLCTIIINLIKFINSSGYTQPIFYTNITLHLQLLHFVSIITGISSALLSVVV